MSPCTFRARVAGGTLATLALLCAAGVGAGTFSAARLAAVTLLFDGTRTDQAGGGDLRATTVSGDGQLGAPAWEAAALLAQRAPASRSIWTADPGAAPGRRGLPFAWPALGPPQQAALSRGPGGASDGLGAARLAWLRGVRADEAPNGLRLRARSGVLGDIAGSQPLLVADADSGYARLPGAEGASYAQFRAGSAYRARPPTVYVGANDGMLHAFDATTGEERFAYVPADVLARASRLTDGSFAGEPFLVDGSPRAIDAWLDGSWQTVLVGATGAGGRAVFALRITDPLQFGAESVLWEYGAARDATLGQAVPMPSVARMANGKWAAIVANGYGGAGGTARLLLVDLASGELLRAIDTGAGPDNGLSSPIAVDVDGNRVADAVYAGDLLGNLWKFDVSAPDPAAWDVAFHEGSAARPLFRACASSDCGGASAQAITARPEVAARAEGGVVVLVGTGRYWQRGDQERVAPVDSFYAVFDADPATPVGAGRARLQAQDLVSAGSGDGAVRTTRVVPVPAEARGWFVDLPERGERVVAPARLRGGHLVTFMSLLPVGDPPGRGNRGWLMELDLRSGAPPAVPSFDLDGDHRYDAADLVDGGAGPVAAGGIRLDSVGTQALAVLRSGNVDLIHAASADSAPVALNAERFSGRRSWRQLP